MRRKHSGSLLSQKQQYETPQVEFHCFEIVDIVRTSNGVMQWGDGWGDWNPSRGDTFVE